MKFKTIPFIITTKNETQINLTKDMQDLHTQSNSQNISYDELSQQKAPCQDKLNAPIAP